MESLLARVTADYNSEKSCVFGNVERDSLVWLRSYDRVERLGQWQSPRPGVCADVDRDFAITKTAYRIRHWLLKPKLKACHIREKDGASISPR